MLRKVTPFLWFQQGAEDAAQYYVSIFPNSEVTSIVRAGGDDAPVISVSFILDGQEFLALNGGPEFTFNEAVSFLIDCADAAEVDHYWDALTAGGEPGPCGWLKDKFGLSWQVVPRLLSELMQDEDREKATRVMQAMRQMSKIEVSGLLAAANA